MLHRDVSGGNIMITQSGSGILNDWDLSRPRTAKFPRQEDRTVSYPMFFINEFRADSSNYRAHGNSSQLRSCFFLARYTRYMMI
jgi:hypothetical protein